MKIFASIRSLLVLLSILLASWLNLFGQADNTQPRVEASYEVKLQLIVGSNDDSKNSLPPDLRGGVTEQLRSNFGFSGYRLDNTFVGRVGGSGSFEYKSIWNTAGTDADSPSFLEWSLGRLRSATNEKGQAVLLAEPFRFGARVPVKVSTVTEGGKTLTSVNYESIGLTVNRVSLAPNTPTLIGTLSLPKTAGTIFLVLTVRPAE